MAKDKSKTEGSETLVEEIIKTIKGIRYGYVQITVHDSKVVQIDKTEKIRMCTDKGGDK